MYNNGKKSKIRKVLKILLFKGDWCVNAGNWNWISSGDPEEILTSSSCICPVRNGKKVDPEGTFIKLT